MSVIKCCVLFGDAANPTTSLASTSVREVRVYVSVPRTRSPSLSLTKVRHTQMCVLCGGVFLAAHLTAACCELEIVLSGTFVRQNFFVEMLLISVGHHIIHNKNVAHGSGRLHPRITHIDFYGDALC